MKYYSLTMSDILTHIKDHDTLYAGHTLTSNSATIGGKLLASRLLNDNNPLGAPDWMNAIMQEDGNFVVYFAKGHARGQAEGYAKWATGTNGRGTGPYTVSIASNGNLILTDSRGSELWHAALNGNLQRVMQDDGNLVIYDANNRPLWASNTAGQNQD